MNTFLLIPLFLGNLRGWEWIIILVVILLLFGGKKIPQLMRGLGKGVRSFKEGLNDIDEEIKDGDGNDKKKGSDAGTNNNA